MLKAHPTILRSLTCMIFIMLSVFVVWAQKAETTVNELVNNGYENVRWVETQDEFIYTLENNTYKAQGVGIAKAIDIIQKHGLPTNKRCKVIVTNLEIPELSLTYEPVINEPNEKQAYWQTSYEIEDSWKEVKKEKSINSSRFKADILIYPQLSFQNMDITKIYQIMFSLNPALEISLWSGMKFTGQIILPLYVDTKGYAAYSPIHKKVRPGFITFSQRFRLPLNIKGNATIGYFNANRYGMDLKLFRPCTFDPRFSLEGRVGLTGIGYWDGFNIYYDKDMIYTWTVGANFYWPEYNTQFSLKGEQYLLGERGIKFEMIRHFRYTSIGFYAMKAEQANSNGGFRFQILLPPYKQKRFKNKYIPRITTSDQIGVTYNAGNERIYYKQYRSESDENIMNDNRFNPYFIKSEITNY